MQILLLTQNFPPEAGSVSFLMEEMATYLAGKGHQVSVVSQVPCYPAGVVYPGYEGAWFRREAKNGFRITRTWSYASPERQRFWSRFLNYVSFMGTALAGIFSGPRPDVILVYSPPLFLGLTATVVAKLWKRPFVFFVMDLWPRAALHLGFMQDNAFYRLACDLEKFIYRHATRVFVYSQRMCEEVVADGANRDDMECHPPWIDTEVFHPDPVGAAQIRRRYGWEGKFVVLYGGNIGLAQGLEVMIESAHRLAELPDIHFVLVGSGVEKEKLATLTASYRLANVEFIGYQPKEQVCAFFSAADLLFAHLKEAPHRVGTVPEKMLAYMACGRPLLMAAQDGAAADLVRENRCGVVVPPDNPEALAQTIKSLYQNPQSIEAMGREGRRAAETRFAGPVVFDGIEASLVRVARFHQTKKNVH